MKVPRDWSGAELIKRLGQFGYMPTRQTGSHVRLTRTSTEGEHHVTVPKHNPLRVGTLNAILGDVADHLHMGKDDLLRQI